MNVRMWEHAATQDNVATLQQRGVHVVPPAIGPMACGEFGAGRMPEPADILDAVLAFFRHQQQQNGPLAGKSVLVTAGPTHEPLDPVRYLPTGHPVSRVMPLQQHWQTLGQQLRW